MTSLLSRHLAHYRATRARALGCDESAFDSNDLTIVERPAEALEPYAAMFVTFGTGTVISAGAEYLGWLREHAPSPHFRAFYPPALIQPLVDHAAQSGQELVWRGPNLGFLLGGQPQPGALPAGLRVERVDRDWRAKYLQSSVFSNALGEPGNAFVDAIWQYGLAIIAPDGEPAAVAGAYDDGPGLHEIGIDVAREFRGKGLARALVGVITQDIFRSGLVPTYHCAPTNVRSHRTALSCGFVPCVSTARVGLAAARPQPAP